MRRPPRKTGSLRRARLAAVPHLSLFVVRREKGRKGKEKKERTARTYTLRSLTPDHPPPAENTGNTTMILKKLIEA